MNHKQERFFCVAILAVFMTVLGCEADSQSKLFPDFDTDDNGDYYYPYEDSDPEEDTGDDHDYALRSCFSPDYTAPTPAAGEGANEGEACERTSDCLSPLLCLDAICAAPGPRENYCDGVAVLCPQENQECVNFECVDLDDSCSNSLDCPAGYECVCDGFLCLKHMCRPEGEECVFDSDCEEGQVCDFGNCLAQNQCSIAKDLRGNYNATSVLEMGVANESAIGGLINATQWIRNLLGGGGGFPGLSDMIADLIRGFLMYNVSADQIDVILSLVDVADILNEVRIYHEISLDGTCSEMYRGQMTFERMELQYNGQVFTARFEDIPSIGALPPVDFGATMQCQSLAFDEIYVDYIASGSVRYATDVLVQTITQGKFRHLEGVLTSLIDCNAIAGYVAAVNPLISALVQPACSLAVKNLIRNVAKSLSDKPSSLGWMKIQGEANVVGGQLEDGVWFGKTLTSSFDGSYTGSTY